MNQLWQSACQCTLHIAASSTIRSTSPFLYPSLLPSTDGGFMNKSAGDGTVRNTHPITANIDKFPRPANLICTNCKWRVNSGAARNYDRAHQDLSRLSVNSRWSSGQARLQACVRVPCPRAFHPGRWASYQESGDVIKRVITSALIGGRQCD